MEVNSVEDAIKVMEDNIAGSVAEAMILLRDEAEDLTSQQVQSILVAANKFMETAKASDRLTGSVLDMLQDVIAKVDPTSLNLREVIRNVNRV